MPHKEALAAQVIGLHKAGCELSGRHVLLVGAGWAGRAVAFAVAGAGAVGLTIANRTAARASGSLPMSPPAFPSSRWPPDRPIRPVMTWWSTPPRWACGPVTRYRSR